MSGEPDHLLVPGARRNVLAVTLPFCSMLQVPDEMSRLPPDRFVPRKNHFKITMKSNTTFSFPDLLKGALSCVPDSGGTPPPRK